MINRRFEITKRGVKIGIYFEIEHTASLSIGELRSDIIGVEKSETEGCSGEEGEREETKN